MKILLMPRTESRATFGILAVFLVAAIAIFFTSDPSCRVVGGPCYAEANHWGSGISEALLRFGKMVSLQDPSQAFTAWPPGFGAFEAFTRIVGPQSNVTLLILLQLLMVVVAGLWVQKIVDEFYPGYGAIGLALVVLNPNILIHANLPKGEIALMFLVFVAFVCVFEFAKRPRWWLVIACGAVLGLSALVRPVTQFLVYTLPGVFLLIALVSGHAAKWRSATLQGALATIVAIAVVFPWLAYVNDAGEGYRMVDRAEEHLFFLDNLRFLSAEAPGRWVLYPKQDYLAAEEAALASEFPNWSALSKSEQSGHRLERIKDYYLSGAIAPGVFAKAIAWSWVRTLAGAGAGWAQVLYTGVSADVRQPSNIWFTGFSGTFVVIARVLGLIGMWALIRQRRYGLLAACLGLLIYVTVLPLAHGQSRYRVTIEPHLAILAAAGIAYLHHGWLLLRNSRRAPGAP